jgi:hypothetical protein
LLLALSDRPKLGGNLTRTAWNSLIKLLQIVANQAFLRWHSSCKLSCKLSA